MGKKREPKQPGSSSGTAANTASTTNQSSTSSTSSITAEVLHSSLATVREQVETQLTVNALPKDPVNTTTADKTRVVSSCSSKPNKNPLSKPAKHHPGINNTGGTHKKTHADTTQGASVKLSDEEVSKLIKDCTSEIVQKFDKDEQGQLTHVFAAMAASRSVRALYFLSKQNKDCLLKLRDIVQGKLEKRKENQMLAVTLVCPKEPNATNKPFIEVKLVDRVER